jgi:leader peptidase (prepilin peptidase)/N-methyltransferase
LAADTVGLLKILLLGAVSGAAIDFALGVYISSVKPLKKSFYYVVLLAAMAVALLPFLISQGDLWWKAAWGEVFLLFSLIDLNSRRVPNELIVVFTLAGLVFSFAGFGPRPESAIYGLAFGFGFFLVLAILWKGGMGFGDVKFAAMSGVAVGFPGIFWALMWGVIAGGLIAGALLLTRKASRKDKFPYVPPLAAGIWIYMLAAL